MAGASLAPSPVIATVARGAGTPAPRAPCARRAARESTAMRSMRASSWASVSCGRAARRERSGRRQADVARHAVRGAGVIAGDHHLDAGRAQALDGRGPRAAGHRGTREAEEPALRRRAPCAASAWAPGGSSRALAPGSSARSATASTRRPWPASSDARCARCSRLSAPSGRRRRPRAARCSGAARDRAHP